MTLNVTHFHHDYCNGRYASVQSTAGRVIAPSPSIAAADTSSASRAPSSPPAALTCPVRNTTTMSVGGAQLPPGQGVSPLNFIYSCAVCCDTFADIYHSHDETVQGLSDGINPKHRLVTKLFLASCCHIFCSKHLSGGGTSKPSRDSSQTTDLISTQLPSRWHATASTLSSLCQGEG